MNVLDRVHFIINPHSQGGRTASLWQGYIERFEQIAKNRYLDSTIDIRYTVADGISTGIAATLTAIQDGATLIISIGGEGGNNEVANGILQSGKSVPMGFIRAGTANDFLSENSYNWPMSLDDQISTILNAKLRPHSLVKVAADSNRYSLNVAEAGIGSHVSYSSSVKRRLKWIKSGFKYTLLAIGNVLVWKNIPATVYIDNQEPLTGNLSLFMSGFTRQSGEFLVLPHAQVHGDKFGYLLAFDFGKLQMIGLMNKLKKGDYYDVPGIYHGLASSIRIEADRPLIITTDGESYSYKSFTMEVNASVYALQLVDPTGI